MKMELMNTERDFSEWAIDAEENAAVFSQITLYSV